MLDGLDEIANQGDDNNFIKVIDNFIGTFISGSKKGNYITITERGTGPFGAAPERAPASLYYIPEFDRTRCIELVNDWIEVLAERTAVQIGKASRLSEEIQKEPFAQLAGNPFYLTLMIVTTICRNPDQILLKPAASRILHLFFSTISGLWNHVRSIHPGPSPTPKDLSPELTQALLSNLAREMVRLKEENRSDLTSSEALILVSRLYSDFFSLQPDGREQDRLRSREFADRFSDFVKAAGILDWLPNPSSAVTFGHGILLDWFCGLWFYHRLPAFKERISSYISSPTPERYRRRDCLAFALGAMESIGGNIHELFETTKDTLELRTLDSEVVNDVAPLGLDLCVTLMEHGQAFSGVESLVLEKLLLTFDNTHYAVLTNDLYPRVQRLIERAGSTLKIPPREPGPLETWIRELESQSNETWIKEITGFGGTKIDLTA